VNVIGTKWVFKNKQGEDGEVVRNKARLVAKGYNQVEGLDFIVLWGQVLIYTQNPRYYIYSY
jgi:hypothetical protein